MINALDAYVIRGKFIFFTFSKIVWFETFKSNFLETKFYILVSYSAGNISILLIFRFHRYNNYYYYFTLPLINYAKGYIFIHHMSLRIVNYAWTAYFVMHSLYTAFSKIDFYIIFRFKPYYSLLITYDNQIYLDLD